MDNIISKKVDLQAPENCYPENRGKLSPQHQAIFDNVALASSLAVVWASCARNALISWLLSSHRKRIGQTERVRPKPSVWLNLTSNSFACITAVDTLTVSD